jgi:lipooligosaccharide transport system ATP-binding protein
MANSHVIEARALTKRYGEFTAVRGIDLEVDPGECFALLGPNGAGKSTTIRMICCLTEVTEGSLRVLGRTTYPGNLELKRSLGVVSQEDYLDPGLTVLENTEIHGRFYGIGAAEARSRALELLAFLQLDQRAGDMVRELSGGMRRRLVIARALMGRPQLLVLDEPTTGLDPQARLLVWAKLRELRAAGVTVLITTHYMDEAERLADRLAIVDHGSILDRGTPREVIERVVGPDCVECLGVSDDHAVLLRRAADGVPGARSERQGDGVVVFARDADAVVAAWRGAGIEPERFIRRPSSLEDVFLSLTGRDLRE